MQICFSVLGKKLNCGSKTSVLMSIITTLLENNVVEHFASGMKYLCANMTNQWR